MKAFLPLILSLFTLALLEWFVAAPNQMVWPIILLVLSNLATALLLSRSTKQAGWWNFVWLPLLANLIVMSYALIIAQSLLLQAVLVALAVFSLAYWRKVWLYLVGSRRYVSFSLENLSFYANFVLVFLLGSVAYGLRSYLSLPPLGLGLVTMLVLAIIIYQGVWVSKLSWRKLWLHWLVAWLILGQMFYALLLLPLDHNVLGLIWGTNYYLIVSLINDKIAGKVSWSKNKFYFIIVAVIWLVILLTARWI